MKKTILAIIIALISLVAFQANAVAGNDKPITVSQLPAAAQQIIKKHFRGKKVALAKQDTGIFDKSYEVVFTSGENIEFDRKGNWTEIDCKLSAVPAALVPVKIARYVKSNYPGAKILKIERDSKEYEVKLSNRMELTFNKSFHITDIDR